MNEEQKAHAKWLSTLYAAVGNGRVLQFYQGDTIGWRDIDPYREGGPNLHSIMSLWRIRPTQFKWTMPNTQSTKDEKVAEAWVKLGYNVTKWVEVEE